MAVSFKQNLAIRRQHHRNRVRQQDNLCCKKSSCPVQRRKSYACIVQIDRFHELVKRHMRICTAEPGKGWNRDAQKCRQWFSPKTRKSEVEPDHIWAFLANCFEHMPGITESVELPASCDRKSIQLGLQRRVVVGQNFQGNARNSSQLTCYVKAVLVQRVSAGRERGH